MKIKLLWILSWCLINTVSAMDSSEPKRLADCFPQHNYGEFDAEVGKGDPYLFEIRIPNETVLPGISHPHKTRFFLLGSQHNVPIEILQRSTHYVAERCDVLIKEIYNAEPKYLGDFDDIPMEDFTKHGLISPDNKMEWVKYLDSDALKILHEKITPRTQRLWGVDADHVSYVVIENYLEERERGWNYFHHHGMDYSFRDYFEKKGKMILALEDGKVRAVAGNKIEVLAKKAKWISLLKIEKLLKNFEYVETPPTNLNIQLLHRYPRFFSGSLEGENKDQSVINRNKAWVPVLKEHLVNHQTKNVLICVGLGHFEGGENLLELLSQEGFELIPIVKEGHTNPRLSSFCNYLMGYTYEELLKEAAEKMILNRPLPNQEVLQKELRQHYAESYKNFLDILEFYQQPGALTSEYGPGGFSHSVINQDWRKYCSLICEYSLDPNKHTFFQRSNEGNYYLDVFFKTDLGCATAIIDRKTYKAKQRAYGFSDDDSF